MSAALATKLGRRAAWRANPVATRAQAANRPAVRASVQTVSALTSLRRSRLPERILHEFAAAEAVYLVLGRLLPRRAWRHCLSELPRGRICCSDWQHCVHVSLQCAFAGADWRWMYRKCASGTFNNVARQAFCVACPAVRHVVPRAGFMGSFCNRARSETPQYSTPASTHATR